MENPGDWKRTYYSKEIKPRIFHLNDFPVQIYISIEEKFRKKLFNTLRKSKLNKELKIPESNISRWKYGKRFVSVKTLLIICNKLVKNGYKGSSIFNVEKRIEGFRGKTKNKVIKNPRLPWEENKKIINLVAHMICDGHDGGEKHSPVYGNTEIKLIKQVLKDLTFFGTVPYKIRVGKTSSKNKIFLLEFPRAITHILRKFYKIRFDSKNARVPRILWKLPNNLLFSFIKAFGDDEGYVRDNRIEFYSTSRLLLIGLKDLIRKRIPELSRWLDKIELSNDKTTWILKLKKGCAKFYKNNIGFIHPFKSKSMNIFLFRSSFPGNRYKEGEAKQIILRKLSEKPYSVTDLALILKIKRKNVRYHLNGLLKKNEIKIISTSHNCYLYSRR